MTSRDPQKASNSLKHSIFVSFAHTDEIAAIKSAGSGISHCPKSLWELDHLILLKRRNLGSKLAWGLIVLR
jgi:hypothetical protein